MKNRGAGNIEFILAFVLFVSFTATALYFFSPVKNVQTLESSREYVEGAIVANASVELESYSIIIDEDNHENNIEVSLPGISSTKSVRAVGYYGNLLESKRETNSDRVCFSRSQERLIALYFSEDIEGEWGGCSGSAEGYEIASSTRANAISEKKILQLKERYSTNYSLLKKELGVPSGIDFSFSFEFPDNENITAERAIPLRREVFSDVQTKEILRENGELVFGYISVKVW